MNCGSCGEGPLASYGYLLLDPGVKACSDCIDKEKSDPRYRGAEVQELRDYADRMVSVHGCAPAQADAVFEKGAESVIDQVKLDCSIDAPDAPEGLEADLSKAVLEYLPGSGGELRQITRVDSYSQCSGDHFRVLAGHIELCPGVCHELENDDEGELWVHAKCRPPCTPTGPEVCEDRVDNDCDGLIDGYDEDCWR